MSSIISVLLMLMDGWVLVIDDEQVGLCASILL